MKIYFHLFLEGFTNNYLIVNDDPNVKQAILIDPGKITNELIQQIEKDNYQLTAVLITHNHTHHIQGLSTLSKIYSCEVYAADSEVYGNKTNVLHGDGTIECAGLPVHYFSLPGHTADSLVYKIGNALFTGDILSAGMIGSTTTSYSKKLLRSNIEKKIFSEPDSCVIFPGHGPLTTVGAEKHFNLDIYNFFGNKAFSAADDFFGGKSFTAPEDFFNE